MRLAALLVVAFGAAAAAPALAKLPPLGDDAKAKAAEAAAKAAWSDKVAAYRLCLSMDHVAEVYRKEVKSAGKEAPAPAPAAACVDPGPYASTPSSQKPIEASGAHSSAGNATSPPSTNVPAAQAQGSAKK